jgi:DNA-binding NtrC family response regulator
MPAGWWQRFERWSLSGTGVLAVLYAIVVLWVAATAADLRLRVLLTDQQADLAGVEIRAVLSDCVGLAFSPQSGDRLVSVARTPVRSFRDFTAALADLRSAPREPEIEIQASSDLLATMGDLLPPVVRRDGRRWVEVEIERMTSTGTAERHKTRLLVHPLPPFDLGLSILWFAMQLGIFALAALSYWKRPFDRGARLFFAMCSVTLGAFVGGFHWWLIASSVWLSVPLVICGVLLPVVTLHFFLVYPEPKRRLAPDGVWGVLTLYGLPVAALVWLVVLAMATSPSFGPAEVDRVRQLLATLETGLRAYFVCAGVYFAATLAALVNSAATVRNPLQQTQVRWIVWAAMGATLPVGYALYLACVDEASFALGQASIPMFTASLLFMLAYAVGIARYKLMVVDELLSRGMVYFLVNAGVAALFAGGVVATTLLGMSRGAGTPDGGRSWPVLAVVTCAVIALTWLRGRLQGWFDRRFFREKYPLDGALQRINQALGRTVEPELLAERMLASCRDALHVEHGAVYLRDPQTSEFQLVATEGLQTGKWNWPTDQELLRALQDDSSGTGNDVLAVGGESAAQRVLRALNIQLVHALAGEGETRGLVLLGPKRSGGEFTAEDLAFLTALGQITGVALYAARIQVMVSRLNDEVARKQEKLDEQQRLVRMLQEELAARNRVEPAAEPGTFRHDRIKGSSPSVTRLLETVRKVAASEATVLIRGESGTGKELLARTLHDNSPRRGGPLVSVHCGALSAGLLESELFGHVKGAFTGAVSDRAGRFELAHGGTLFLDEIGDISMETQIKLLRVLQERTFEPVGGNRSIEVDVRVVAATHQNLEQLIRQGKFREDLFYRLNVITLTSPPLREREDDIFELAMFFLSREAARSGKPVTTFEDEAMLALRGYAWPGNIRQLENVIERAVVLSEGPLVRLTDLPVELTRLGTDEPALRRKPRRSLVSRWGATREPESTFTPLYAAEEGSRPESERPESERPESERAEREILLNALREAGGNKSRAARLLGMPRSTLFSKLAKHGLEESPPKKG